jgi:hypothetical protein
MAGLDLSADRSGKDAGYRMDTDEEEGGIQSELHRRVNI